MHHDEDEKRIEELRALPEFRNVEKFIEDKMNSNDVRFSTAELQALARNAHAKCMGFKRGTDCVAPSDTVRKIRMELTSYGMEFVPRTNVASVRGFTSPSHGTSRFAGNFGGSGMGSNLEGPMGFGFASGPGAIKSDEVWDPNDPRNLPMGAGRGKR